MSRVPRWVAGAGLLICALALSARPRAEAGCCHSPGGCPGNPIPPTPWSSLREPFDPPPPEPEDATEPPQDGQPSGGPPAPPTDPEPTPRPSTLPSAPTSPAQAPSATTPRRAGGASVDTLTAASWQYWWSLNQPDFLPPVKRRGGQAGAPYASALDPLLRPAVDLLLTALRDPDRQVAQAAAGALTGFTTEYRAQDTLLALRAAARTQDPWLRDLCHLGLGARKDAAALADLRHVAFARHEQDVSRVFAALALIQVGGREVHEDVYRLTQDLSAPEVAGAVLVGLAGTGDVAHLPTLLEAARRRTGAAGRLRRVRADALTALGRLAHPSTVPFLAGLLDDGEYAIARSAAIALGGSAGNAEAAEALGRACLGAEDPWVRALAAVSLGRGNAPQALPSLARMLREERDVAVRGFATLALGLTGIPGSERLLGPALAEDPRTGEFGAAALAAGLLRARDHAPALLPALKDTRTHLAPGCAALACGLLGSADARPALRERFWLDSSRVRPGFDRGLALLSGEDQAAWLVGQLRTARRAGERHGLLQALALCAGPHECDALVRLFSTAPPGDSGTRVRILLALAELLRDHEVTPLRRLLLHTYYLQPNDALNHLGLLR